MQRKSLSWNVKQVISMVNKSKTIRFDNPVQRPAGQWKRENQSLLIHSILCMFIPDIYCLQVEQEIDGKTVKTYDVLDGLQRIVTIDTFLKNEWALTDLPTVKLDSNGQEYNISGLTFSELPEEVQEEINGYTLTFKIIEIEEGESEEEIVDEIFYRLNNGVPVDKSHLALVAAPKNVQQFVRDTVNNSKLYTNVAHFAQGSIKKSDREMSVLQSIVLASGLPYNSFAAKDIEKFFVDNTIEDDLLNKVSSAMNKIAEAYNSEHSKFMTKINIPSFVELVYNSEDQTTATAFTRAYADNSKKGDSYRRHCGSGNTKPENVRGRVEGLKQLYQNYLKVMQN